MKIRIFVCSLMSVLLATVAFAQDKTYNVNALSTYGVAPTIDGTVSAGEWDEAATPGCTGFVLHNNETQAAAEDPTVLAVFDYDNLYIVFQLPNSDFALAFDPTAGDPENDYRDPTNATYSGDDLEVFLAPAGINFPLPGNTCYHIVFFPYEGNGQCYITETGSSTAVYPGATSWNPLDEEAAFTYNSTTQELIVEYRIAWTQFDVAPDTTLAGHPADGATWGCQLGSINNNPAEAVNWEPDGTAGFVQGRPFGAWVFTGTPPAPPLPLQAGGSWMLME